MLNSAVCGLLHEPGELTAALEPMGAGIRTTLWAAAVGTLILGIFPSLLLNFARDSGALVK